MATMHGHCNLRLKIPGVIPAAIALILVASPAVGADARALLREAFERTMSRPVRFEGSLMRYGPQGRVAQKSRWRFERTGRPGEGRVKITFLEPTDLEGVKLLIRTTPDGSTEQWLYTPAADRIRPIRPDARGRRFYSTDFTFDDLQEADVGLRSYSLAGLQEAAGESCQRIEAKTVPGAPYDEKVFFISEATKLIVQIDCFLDSSRVKRILYRDYNNRHGVWLPGEIEAIDIETGWRTVVVLENAEVGAVFSEGAFEPESLPLP